MKIYDVTRTYEVGMKKYYKLPEPVLERYGKMEEGARCNTSRIELGCHLGTHIDSPFHFDPNGTRIDQLDVTRLIGKTKVVKMNVGETVDVDTIEKAHFTDETIATFSFGIESEDREEPYFTSEAAKKLVDMGMKVIATDNLNVDVGRPRPIHSIFLPAGLYIIEGIDLEKTPEGCYNMIALPLKLKDLEASPARVILLREE